jgi:hypothetical protein
MGRSVYQVVVHGDLEAVHGKQTIQIMEHTV